MAAAALDSSARSEGTGFLVLRLPLATMGLVPGKPCCLHHTMGIGHPPFPGPTFALGVFLPSL